MKQKGELTEVLGEFHCTDLDNASFFLCAPSLFFSSSSFFPCSFPRFSFHLECGWEVEDITILWDIDSFVGRKFMLRMTKQRERRSLKYGDPGEQLHKFSVF